MKQFFIQSGKGLVAICFIISAILKVYDWQAKEADFAVQLSEWLFILEKLSLSEDLMLHIQTLSSLLLGVGVVIELVCGFFLLMGSEVKIASFILFAHVITEGVFQHPFWQFSGMKFFLELELLVPSIGLAGSLLVFFALGSQFEEKKIPSSSLKLRGSEL